MTSEFIKSVSWRLAHRDAFAKGHAVFSSPLQFIPGSQYLEVTHIPALRDDTKCSELYLRAETDTYVNRIEGGIGVKATRTTIVAKCFGISALPDTPHTDHLLCEHEIETRYLLLMTSMMRGGLLEAGTLPLALYIAGTGRILCATGLLLRHQARAVRARDSALRAKGRPKRRYAVLLAESADECLTNHLFHAPTTQCDYWLRTSLLQVSLALAVLHTLFPTFRHNDLHASNVLVQRIDVAELRRSLHPQFPPNYPLVVEYALGERRWQVDLDRAPFRCLLWDFSFASIGAADGCRSGLDAVVPRLTSFGSVVPLSKTVPNQYCDIMRLVDTLRWVLAQSPCWSALSNDTRAMIDHLVPPNLSWAEKELHDTVKAERQLQVTHGALQHTSPTAMLLWSDWFNAFRVDETPECQRVRPVYRIDGPKEGIHPSRHFMWK